MTSLLRLQLELELELKLKPEPVPKTIDGYIFDSINIKLSQKSL